jgi:6-pyruvoyl-tetrahydropterin synthase
VVPFHEVRQAATSVVQAYNHQLLNDLLPFRTLQPTTENLVAVLCQQLERSLAHLPVELRGITLWESPTKAISYDKSRL